jgi:raffinose/stachyose/melibiose transport system substrate-binding protein
MAARQLRTRLGRRPMLVVVSWLAAMVAIAVVAATSSAATKVSHDTPSGTLHMIVSSAPGSDAGFEAVNSAFAAAYPNVKVDFSAIPNGDYAAAESSRLTAGSVDILVAAPTQVPKYANGAETNDDLLADNGGFLNLAGQPFMKRFLPTVLNGVVYKGHDYLLPTGLSYFTGVYYNKAIFAKYHLSIPTTWSAFLKLAHTLKAHGVTPLGMGGKDGWPPFLPLNAAVNGEYPTTAAKQALAKGLWNQTVKLTDPKPLQILKIEKQVYSLTQKNFPGVPYNDIPGLFAAGKFAMTPDGTWNNVTMQTAVGSNFGIGYFPIPTSNNPKDNSTLNGKPELTLAIASSTHNKTAALAYMDFFSQPANYKLFLAHAGFAPSEPNIPLSPFLNSIAPYTKKFNLAWGSIWTGNPKAGAAASFPFNYLGVAPMGGGTPASAAKASQKAWAAGF